MSNRKTSGAACTPPWAPPQPCSPLPLLPEYEDKKSLAESSQRGTFYIHVNWARRDAARDGFCSAPVGGIWMPAHMQED